VRVQDPSVRVPDVRRLWCIVVVAAVIVPLGAAAVPTGADGPVGGATGHPGEVITGYNGSVGELNDVACPTQRECIGVGQTAGTDSPVIVITASHGRRWTEVSPPATAGQLNGISCIDGETCVVVGNGALNGAYVTVTRDGGRTWSRGMVLKGAEELFEVACSSSTCVALGDAYAGADASQQYSTISTSTDGGRNWSTRSVARREPTLSGLACPTPDTCVIVGNDSDRSDDVLDGVALWTHDAGATWRSQDIAPANDVLSNVACAPASTCTVTGVRNPSSGAYQAISLSTSDTGTRWSAVRGVKGNAALGAVQCFAGAGCVALGMIDPGSEDSTGFLAITPAPGQPWRLAALPARVELASSLACTSQRACEVVGGLAGGNPAQYAGGQYAGMAMRTTDGGGHWYGQPMPSGLDAVTAMACPTATVCHATAFDAATGRWSVLSTHDGANTWQRWAAPRQVTMLNSISCRGPLNCIAVGASSTSSPDGWVALRTSSGGASWSLRWGVGEELGLQSVSCPAVRDCLALGTKGAPLSTSDQGVRWRPVGEIVDAENVLHVVCQTASRCFAWGNLASFSGLETTSDAGRTWTLVSTPKYLSYLSSMQCFVSGWCVGVGSARSGAMLYVMKGVGRAWRFVHVVPKQDSIDSLWCASIHSCDAAVSRPNGTGFLLALALPSLRRHSVAFLDAANESRVEGSGGWLGGDVVCPLARDCVIAGNDWSSTNGIAFAVVHHG
jgi:hypothetical protein